MPNHPLPKQSGKKATHQSQLIFYILSSGGKHLDRPEKMHFVALHKSQQSRQGLGQGGWTEKVLQTITQTR